MTIQDGGSGGNLEIAGKIVNEAFQNVTFQNGWLNKNGGFSTAQYYKDKEGRVHLKGVVTWVQTNQEIL
jgi:hypothetical protein